MKVRGEWKSWLKTQHLKNEDHDIWLHHVMANRWGNNENSERLYFGGLQNHCRWWLQPWIKRRLPLGRKVMTNLDSILKAETLLCQQKSWTIKKAEHWKIDAFELWCWKRLLRVPWTAGRSNQSTLKEISPEYSLEGLMLKLKLQYFGPLVQRTDSLEKTLMLGKIEGTRRKE